MEFVKLKVKEAIREHCTLVKSSFPWEYELTVLILLYKYAGIEQLNKWMVGACFLSIRVSMQE